MVRKFIARRLARELQQARAQEKIPVLQGFRATYRNKAFLRLVIAFTLLIVGFQVVMGFSNFTTIFYLFDGNRDAAPFGAGSAAGQLQETQPPRPKARRGQARSAMEPRNWAPAAPPPRQLTATHRGRERDQ